MPPERAGSNSQCPAGFWGRNAARLSRSTAGSPMSPRATIALAAAYSAT